MNDNPNGKSSAEASGKSRRAPSRPSFFSITAWYALLAPFVAAGIILFGLSCGIPHHPAGSPADHAFGIAALFLLSSVLASIACLPGIFEHGWRAIVWKSVAGIILSCLVYSVLVFIGMAMIGHQ